MPSFSPRSQVHQAPPWHARFARWCLALLLALAMPAWAQSSNADLSGLALSAGTLSPAFAPGVASYTARVTNAVDSINIIPTLDDANATMTVNGTPVAGGTPQNIVLAQGDNTLTVEVMSEDGTTHKIYTVTDANGCTKTASYTLTGPVAPTVTSVGVPANGMYGVGDTLEFTVHYDTNVTVDPTGGTPSINLTIGSTPRQAVYTRGSGTTALVFAYTVQPGDVDMDGITLGSLALNNGTLTGNGAPASLTLNSVGNTSGVQVMAISAPTNITLSANTVSAGAAIGTEVGLLTTTDADLGESFMYSLASGAGDTHNALFTIGGGNALQVGGSITAPGIYSVRIRTTDSFSLTYEKGFSIVVMPVAGAPDTPTIGTALAGDSQATVHFTPPAWQGPSPVTSYTVKASPGGATATGTASPIVIAGLANGTAYTFTVTAANSAGLSYPSAPSNSVTPQATVQGTVPDGSGGTGTATVSAAAVNAVTDPACRLAGVQFTGDAPPGIASSYGTVDFLATDCSQGVTITLTFPQPLPTHVKFMKYGPKTAAVGGVVAASEWFEWPGTVDVDAARTTIRYTVFDNGVGDSDPRTGYIRDPFVPVVLALPVPASAVAIPTLNAWALALLSMLLGALGWRLRRAG